MLRVSVVTSMDDDDDDLWGPPLVVEEDTLWKQTLRDCEFWFDFRTDVLEEHFQNQRCCEQVWRILLSEKKRDELENEVESSRSGGSSDSDKALSAVLPDADTSSAKSDMDEDENTSSISDAQTIDTRDSSNDTQGSDPETRLKPVETPANDPLTLEVAEDADTFSSPVLASKTEEAEEHSCSSLVTDQVVDPIKPAPESSKSSSAISRESIGGSTSTPETREKENGTKEGGEDHHQQSDDDSLEVIVTASEPFTTESLLEMCDAPPDNGRETSCKERSKVVKDELILNSLTEATQKTESKALMNPRSVLLKKRQNSDNKGKNESFIRNTKQKVQGEISIDPVKKSTTFADSLSGLVDVRSERDGPIVISTSELKNKTGKELKVIAKALKVMHYYKLKKEDLVQRLTMHLSSSS